MFAAVLYRIKNTITNKCDADMLPHTWYKAHSDISKSVNEYSQIKTALDVETLTTTTNTNKLSMTNAHLSHTFTRLSSMNAYSLVNTR